MNIWVLRKNGNLTIASHSRKKCLNWIKADIKELDDLKKEVLEYHDTMGKVSSIRVFTRRKGYIYDLEKVTKL